MLMEYNDTLLKQKKSALKITHANTIIPLHVSIPLNFDTSLGVFAKLNPDFLLESAESAQQVGRYSFMGKNSLLKYTVTVDKGAHMLAIDYYGSLSKHEREIRISDNPIRDIFLHFEQYKTPRDQLYSLPPFWGGLVGYMGFECVRYFEPININDKKPQLEIPDSIFFLPKLYYVVDHLTRKLWLIGLLSSICEQSQTQRAQDADAIIDHIRNAVDVIIHTSLNPAHLVKTQGLHNISGVDIGMDDKKQKNNKNLEDTNSVNYRRHILNKKAYERIVSEGIELLNKGNMIQVVLARDEVVSLLPEKEFDIYMSLRTLNPSPYMYYIKFDNFSVIGASPETMLTLSPDGDMTVRPIAGTIRRGKTKKEDMDNIAQLMQDPKEKAEHLMLIDLARNDLNRVACTDSVRVTRYFEVETFSHVHHIVSEVKGKKREELKPYDVIASCFPAGTLSGAPKVEALQHIIDTEPTKRKIYGGLVGIYGFDGYFDACICIRTMVIMNTTAYLKAGAGVVVDSQSEKEWLETELKLSALTKCLEEFCDSRH